MKKVIVLLLSCLLAGATVHAQGSAGIKEQFEEDIRSGAITLGCKMVITIGLDVGLPFACVVPEPTVSKVACAMATTYQALGPVGQSMVKDSGVKVCRISVGVTKTAVTYTMDLAENQLEEAKGIWNWLNTLEGVTYLMYQLSR